MYNFVNIEQNLIFLLTVKRVILISLLHIGFYGIHDVYEVRYLSSGCVFPISSPDFVLSEYGSCR
jgi:hypothetical protein